MKMIRTTKASLCKPTITRLREAAVDYQRAEESSHSSSGMVPPVGQERQHLYHRDFHDPEDVDGEGGGDDDDYKPPPGLHMDVEDGDSDAGGTRSRLYKPSGRRRGRPRKQPTIEVLIDNVDIKATCQGEAKSEGTDDASPKKPSRKNNAELMMERPYRCKRDGCGQTFVSQLSLRKHAKLKHTDDQQSEDPQCNQSGGDNSENKAHRKYKCLKCTSSFNQKGNLKVHQRIHSGERPYKCDSCEKCFRDNGSLKRHNLTHLGIKLFECEVCKQNYSSNIALREHMSRHTDTKPYSCDVCSKNFRQVSCFMRHMTIHSGEKRHKCQICDKMFAHTLYLKSHMKMHTGEKPFRCEICGKAFAHASDVKRHQNVHLGLKPYVCDICGAKFGDPSSRRRHVREHEGAKPFCCQYCHEMFKRSTQLKTHLKNKHFNSVKLEFQQVQSMPAPMDGMILQAELNQGQGQGEAVSQIIQENGLSQQVMVSATDKTTLVDASGQPIILTPVERGDGGSPSGRQLAAETQHILQQIQSQVEGSFGQMENVTGQPVQVAYQIIHDDENQQIVEIQYQPVVTEEHQVPVEGATSQQQQQPADYQQYQTIIEHQVPVEGATSQQQQPADYQQYQTVIEQQVSVLQPDEQQPLQQIEQAQQEQTPQYGQVQQKPAEQHRQVQQHHQPVPESPEKSVAKPSLALPQENDSGTKDGEPAGGSLDCRLSVGEEGLTVLAPVDMEEEELSSMSYSHGGQHGQLVQKYQLKEPAQQMQQSIYHLQHSSSSSIKEAVSGATHVVNPSAGTLPQEHVYALQNLAEQAASIVPLSSAPSVLPIGTAPVLQSSKVVGVVDTDPPQTAMDTPPSGAREQPQPVSIQHEGQQASRKVTDIPITDVGGEDIGGAAGGYGTEIEVEVVQYDRGTVQLVPSDSGMYTDQREWPVAQSSLQTQPIAKWKYMASASENHTADHTDPQDIESQQQSGQNTSLAESSHLELDVSTSSVEHPSARIVQETPSIAPSPEHGASQRPPVGTTKTTTPEAQPDQDTDDTAQNSSLHFLASDTTAQFVQQPDFDSQEYYNWLSQFTDECKNVDMPLAASLFKHISQVHKTLSDVLAMPTGILTNRDNFRILMNISHDLNGVISKHLTCVLLNLEQTNTGES